MTTVGITAAVQAFSKALSELFGLLKEGKLRQSERELIKENRKLKKAADLAEEIIEIVYRYIRYFSEEDRARVRKLIKKFNKND